MINGKLFTKFQKLLPKMNEGLEARDCAKNAFFMADDKGCAATDGFSLLYAPMEDACEQPVVLNELPKAKFGDTVFIDVSEFGATIKDGGMSAAVPQDERDNEVLLGKMRKLYVRELPAEDACEQPVALNELPKVKIGDAVFVDVGKFDATIKDGGTSVSVQKDETGKEALLEKMRKLYVRDMPAHEAPAVITVNATLLKNLLDAFEGDVRIEITHPEGKYQERQIYLHGENLQAMLLPVKPVEVRNK